VFLVRILKYIHLVSGSGPIKSVLEILQIERVFHTAMCAFITYFKNKSTENLLSGIFSQGAMSHAAALRGGHRTRRSRAGAMTPTATQV
jgi:hypothetical protein